jgi:hypothetical protein
MNAVQLTPVGGHAATPAAPVAHAGAPVEVSNNHSAIAQAVAAQQASQAAASARARAQAEQHAAQEAAKKAAQAAPPPPPPPPVSEPRFDRKVGFVPGTSKVYIDLVNISYQKLSYRIYGPTANPVALPVLPAPPQPPKPSTVATDAYTHAGTAGEPGKDVAVA